MLRLIIMSREDLIRGLPTGRLKLLFFPLIVITALSFAMIGWRSHNRQASQARSLPTTSVESGQSHLSETPDLKTEAAAEPAPLPSSFAETPPSSAPTSPADGAKTKVAAPAVHPDKPAEKGSTKTSAPVNPVDKAVNSLLPNIIR